MQLKRIHHVAIICSDYQVSRKFYSEVLGLRIIAEAYRAGRDSYKLDLAVDDMGQIELFSFPGPPKRISHPEAAGLRHLAFEVDDLDMALIRLHDFGVPTEPIRIDEYTGKRFVFFQDPDQLPIELYEIKPDELTSL